MSEEMTAKGELSMKTVKAMAPAILFLCIVLPLGCVVVANSQPRPLVSMAKAQKSVPFTMLAPSWLPAGTRLTGVTTGPIVVQGREDAEEVRRNHRSKLTGFGVFFFTHNGKLMAQSMSGSPARRAGLGKEPVEVLEL